MDLAVNESQNSIHSLKFLDNEIITISEYGKAIHDYSGRAEDELTFEEEDVIYLSLKDETGEWVFGELNGSRGWFPSSNIRVLTEKECISEGLNWPPQSNLLNSTSSFSIKSQAQKDGSSGITRKRCNSRDSFSSYNSSNFVTVPTANEDPSNPILPNQKIRAWKLKYQQMSRYQSKRGPNNIFQTKIGSSALSNPPLAASNASERSSISNPDLERKKDLTSSSLNSSENNANSNITKEKSDISQSLNENMNESSEANKKQSVIINKVNSDDSFSNEKFINEVASILKNNEDTNKRGNSLDDKELKEENDFSIENLNVNNMTGSIQDIPKDNENNNNSNDNNNNNNENNENNDNNNSNNDIQGSDENKPAPPTNLTVNVKDLDKKVHTKLQVGTPTRVIQRVTTPTMSRQKWSDFVSSSTIQNLTKKEIQRQEVMFEMINTEKDYIKDLGIVMNIYINPMRELKIIRPKDIDVIFSDWENILKVHEEIMKRLDERQKEGYLINEIGDIWIQMSDYLKVYMMYCSNHPYALIKLQILSRNKNFTKFLESRVQLPESRNLNLANFLLKPVQRICKYPLLLREIIKNTEEDHPDYKNLVSALYKIETVITVINDAAKQTEGVHKLLELQQRFTTKVNIVANLRTIVHKSEIDIIEKRLNSFDRKKRQMYLLNDMVLLARSSNTGPDSLNTGKLKLIAMISTKEILVKDLEDTPALKNAFELVHTGKQNYKIAVDTPMNKEVWLKMLNNVILNDVQKNKDDSVTAMKPSVETTYKSLNGKHKKKSVSPGTPEYRLSALKFGDTSMIKEVENEFNRINSNMGDLDEESIKDDDKSISDADEMLSPNTYASMDMPSISEGIESDFNERSKKTNSLLPSPKKKNNGEGSERERPVSLIETESKCSTNEEFDDDDIYDKESFNMNANEDIFNQPIHHDSHSFEFEGLRDFYSNSDDESITTKNRKKRYSYPLGPLQIQDFKPDEQFSKAKSESPLLPEQDNKLDSPSMFSEMIVKEDNEIETLSVSVKSSNESFHKLDIDSNKEEDDEKSNANTEKTLNEIENDDKNMIVPLNDMLEDSKKEDEEDELISHRNKFASNLKFYGSLESIKFKEEEKNGKNSKSLEGSERSLNKSSDSINIRGSNCSVFNSKLSSSSESLSKRDEKKKKRMSQAEVEYSFNKLRTMFGNLSSNPAISESCLAKGIDDNKREELKNIILPSRIHNLPNTNRGLMVNTMFDDNKNESPTRLIYDISKNPFIIKDMSYHKNKNTEITKTPRSTPIGGNYPTMPGIKVSSIQKEFFSKDNNYNSNTINFSSLSNAKSKSEHSTSSNSLDSKKKGFRNDFATKSPLTKEIQFDDRNSSNSINSVDTKLDKNKESKNGGKSVKFGLATTYDGMGSTPNLASGGNAASLCVSNKRGKSTLGTGNATTSSTTTNPIKNNTVNNATNNGSSVNNNNNFNYNSSSLTKEFVPSSNSSSLKRTQSSNISKPVNYAKIIDIENVEFESTKKYVYIIEVDRGSDLSIIHHTYDDFFDLHLQLIGNFPEEAGVSIGYLKNSNNNNNNNNNRISRRIIPDLPAQMMFVSEAVARSRVIRLQDYINTILKLPGKISRHPLVMNFFKADGKWSASVYSNKK